MALWIAKCGAGIVDAIVGMKQVVDHTLVSLEDGTMLV